MRLNDDEKEFWFGICRLELGLKFGKPQYKDIAYGCQLRFRDGEIVSLYETGKYSTQGRPNQRLSDFMFSLQQRFIRSLEFERRYP